MSFGWSASDVAALAQLAWRTVQNARKACGEHDEVTREVFALHVVLRRLEKEVGKPESPLNRSDDSCGQEVEAIANGCQNVLGKLDRVLEKYNALGQRERSGRKLWQRVKFGNGELVDLKDLREKATYYTSALSLYLNMVSVGSMGRVEKHMEEAGGELREVKRAVNSLTAHLMAGSTREGSILTSYLDDDKKVWKGFRRELVQKGFSSSFLHKHKDTIQAYFEELGSRGMLDESEQYMYPEVEEQDTNEVSRSTTPHSDFEASDYHQQAPVSSNSTVTQDEESGRIPLRIKRSHSNSITVEAFDIEAQQPSRYERPRSIPNFQKGDTIGILPKKEIDVDSVDQEIQEEHHPSNSSLRSQRNPSDESYDHSDSSSSEKRKFRSVQVDESPIYFNIAPTSQNDRAGTLQFNRDEEEYARWEDFATWCWHDEVLLNDQFPDDQWPKSALLWSETNFLDIGVERRFISSSWGISTQYRSVSISALLAHFEYWTPYLDKARLKKINFEFAPLASLTENMNEIGKTIGMLVDERKQERMRRWLHSGEQFWLEMGKSIQDCSLHVRNYGNADMLGEFIFGTRMSRLIFTIKNWNARFEQEWEDILNRSDRRQFGDFDYTRRHFEQSFLREELLYDGSECDWSYSPPKAICEWRNAIPRSIGHITDVASPSLAEPACFSEELMGSGRAQRQYMSVSDVQQWLAAVPASGGEEFSTAGDRLEYLYPNISTFISNETIDRLLSELDKF